MPNSATSTTTQLTHRGQLQQIFAQFSRAYEAGDLSPARDVFIDDAAASFSTQGDLTGADAIVEALSGGWGGVVVRHYVTNQYEATAAGTGQQSAYLTGLVADERGPDADLEPSWFGGHYATSYRLTEAGWKIAEMRFALDWVFGRHASLQAWPAPRASLGWSPDAVALRTLSALDAPWHVVPQPEDTVSDEQQIVDAFTRYTWAVDQWDLSLLRDIFTEDLATDISPFGAQQGRRAFLGSLQLFRTGRVYLHHVMGKHRVEVSGDRAALQVYRLIPFGVTRELLDRDIFGALYDCALRREDGVWKFESITYTEGNLFEVP